MYIYKKKTYYTKQVLYFRLNEGFASYMEYKGVANYHDDWEIEDQFLSSDLHRVLDLDATLNSHPIVQEVSHPDQITEIFDVISYSKGASVLRMLENFIGPKEFQLGVHNFLEKYKYRNAITSDLWHEFESLPSANLPISDIMDTWTKQMGYPILEVTKVTDNQYQLTQSRYLKSQQSFNASESPYEYKWDVPVTWISSSNNNPTLQWLRRNNSELTLDFPNNTEWVKFNVGQYGFYRVNYPVDDWNKLANLLTNNPNVFSATDRASLLNDAFSLAESGHLSYDIPLKMTSYLSKETNLVPWETVYSKLLDLSKLLEFTPTFPLLNKYIQNLVREHYSRLGWRDEGTHAEKLNRNDIISLACASGIKECKDNAGELFDSWLADPNFFISPNLKTAVLKNGMSSTGNFDTWTTVFERAVKEENAQEKKKLWYGLAQIREPWILHRYLDLAQNETIIRSQDHFTVLHYISQNPVGKSIIWEHLQENWPQLVERFSLNDRYLGRIPKAVTADFSSEFKLRQVKAFFSKYPEAGAGARSRKQALESIENNIKWLDTHQNTVHSWLEGLDM